MNRCLISILAFALGVLPTTVTSSGQLATPENVHAKDVSNHSRNAIRVRWQYDGETPGLAGFEIRRSVAGANDFSVAGLAGITVREFIHEHSLPHPGEDEVGTPLVEEEVEYTYQVVALGAGGVRSQAGAMDAPVAVSIAGWTALQRSTRWLFLWNRFWLAIITFVFCSAVVYWISHARKGREVRVRKIAGLEAVDEAVGRATEMGRSVLFIPGIQDMNDIQTIAGITVLSRVARTAAEYDAKVEVPTSRSLVMTTARETVQAAFLSAGRPDAYNEDLIYYVTDEQFGYVAYLQGMMVREKPAACFYMGHFYAESLILAETGNLIGAIQVAGTAAPAQLPFFVAACDYTLIGEEFFAATAYLSGSAEELGSLKGQDFGKIIVAVGLGLGVIVATLGAIMDSQALNDAVSYLKTFILT